MDIKRVLCGALVAAACAAATAPDMLPLKQGIYVPIGRACKGASNAEMVNYWGGKSSIGVAQAECSIVKMSKAGNTYTLRDRCKDIQSGESIAGGPTVLTIRSATDFSMAGTRYHYCGTKVQF